METFYASDCLRGVDVTDSGAVSLDDSTVFGNAFGVRSYANSHAYLVDCLVGASTTRGVSAFRGSSFQCVDTFFFGNDVATWIFDESLGDSSIGCTFSINTSDYSPAVSTVGNNNSYMK
jgi:hypothetical protein